VRPVALAATALGLLLTGCAAGRGALRPDDVRPDGIVSVQEGSASWYGERWHGRRTASGERFDMHAYTAAHRTLPFGTRCRVTNQANGRKVVVRINDRGPDSHRRVIDLSYAAAAALDFVSAGHARVLVEVLR
jgi:rare lipoprotein A